MLCDECSERNAVVHITKIINNQKTQLSLCEECAKKYQQELGLGFGMDFSIHKFLSGLTDNEYVESDLGKTLKEQVRCSDCGSDYSQFQQYGRLGCPNCYNVFENKIQPLLKRVHGAEKHYGKYPLMDGSDLPARGEIISLKKKLQELIYKEQFEQAAEVRDEIRKMEKEMEGKGG